MCVSGSDPGQSLGKIDVRLETHVAFAARLPSYLLHPTSWVAPTLGWVRWS